MSTTSGFTTRCGASGGSRERDGDDAVGDRRRVPPPRRSTRPLPPLARGLGLVRARAPRRPGAPPPPPRSNALAAGLLLPRGCTELAGRRRGRALRRRPALARAPLGDAAPASSRRGRRGQLLRGAERRSVVHVARVHGVRAGGGPRARP